MERFLPDICDIRYGYAFDSALFSTEHGVPLIRIRDVVRGFSETYTTEQCSEEYIVENGDILIGMDGEFNIARWNGGKAYLNQRVCRLIPKGEIDALYLFYFMPKALKAIEDKTPFVTVKHLSAKELNKIVVPVPTMREQKAISNNLQKLDKLICLRKQQLSKLDELVKSRFIELFGDPNIEFKHESHKFKEVARDMTKGPFGSDMKKELFVPKGEDTYKVYIQANAIQGDQNIGCYYISKEYFDSKIFRFEVHPGDYIITCDGTLGKHLKLNYEMEKGVISSSLLRLALDEEKMSSEYFEYLWDMYILLLMKKEARNACLVHLPSAKVIGEIDIPVPPLAMQGEFSRFVEQVGKSKLAIQKSLEKLETLKKALLQKYFG